MAVPVSSATPIVFLDIDGVLLPFGHADPLHRAAGNQDDFPDECLGALARILEAVPHARLVLSSTWRCWPGGVGHICGEFRRHGGALKDVRFLSMTNKENHSHRQWEIAEWLRGDEGRAVDTWVALDDEELLDGAPLRRHRAWFANHVVKTRSDVGLTAELADRAIALLRAAPVPRPTEAEEAAAAGAADPLAPFTLRSIAGRPALVLDTDAVMEDVQRAVFESGEEPDETFWATLSRYLAEHAASAASILPAGVRLECDPTGRHAEVSPGTVVWHVGNDDRAALGRLGSQLAALANDAAALKAAAVAARTAVVIT